METLFVQKTQKNDMVRIVGFICLVCFRQDDKKVLVGINADLNIFSLEQQQVSQQRADDKMDLPKLVTTLILFNLIYTNIPFTLNSHLFHILGLIYMIWVSSYSLYQVPSYFFIPNELSAIMYKGPKVQVFKLKIYSGSSQISILVRFH